MAADMARASDMKLVHWGESIRWSGPVLMWQAPVCWPHASDHCL